MRSRESQLPKPIVGADHQCAVNDHLRTVWDRDVWKDAGIGRRAGAPLVPPLVGPLRPPPCRLAVSVQLLSVLTAKSMRPTEAPCAMRARE